MNEEICAQILSDDRPLLISHTAGENLLSLTRYQDGWHPRNRLTFHSECNAYPYRELALRSQIALGLVMTIICDMEYTHSLLDARDNGFAFCGTEDEAILYMLKHNFTGCARGVISNARNYLETDVYPEIIRHDSRFVPL